MNYSGFPSLFLLGTGLRRHGSISIGDCRHMLMQFSCNFATCPRFIFSLFDQLQRHAAAQSVAAKFKTNTESLKRLKEWVADAHFLSELKDAAKKPDSAKSRSMAKMISPHVQTFSRAVPFSPAQRRGGIQKLYAMTQHFGMPGIFVTFAPDFQNGVLNLRLSIPSTNNFNLPASEDGIVDALRQQIPLFRDIALTQGMPFLIIWD